MRVHEEQSVEHQVDQETQRGYRKQKRGLIKTLTQLERLGHEVKKSHCHHRARAKPSIKCRRSRKRSAKSPPSRVETKVAAAIAKIILFLHLAYRAVAVYKLVVADGAKELILVCGMPAVPA